SNTAVTLGKFDGLHLGHQELIRQLIREKEQSGLSPVLFSFDTAKRKGVSSLTTFRERARLCETFGIEHLILFPVNERTMAMPAEDFIREILAGELGAKTVVTGTDFHFGKDRKGSVDTLIQYSNLFDYSVITKPSRLYENEKISSSRIKQAMGQGNLKEAETMLGYRYFVMGTVIKGRQLGRTIGIRTLNLEVEQTKLLPLQGVYGTTAVIDGKKYKSITNIGTCPTVTDSGAVTVETHVLDFEEEVYGSEVAVYFEFYIRKERKFENLAALQRQICSDIERVRDYVVV
ncbi:MAG: bifunctional riboflavin kinase/FAD synthetase, partial [Lachnospiraceae bacterium]|nr:bifunctional riboflavin kinase/FAD synthetase [Lachnospiraceae bacterium]